MAGGRKAVMGPAHVPAWRRLFSLGDRHGGTAPRTVGRIGRAGGFKTAAAVRVGWQNRARS